MKPSGIGGQAVIEGVMMKNKSEYAIAVRKPNHEIVVQKEAYIALSERYPILGLPIIRGIIAFGESMAIGMKTLTFSASFYEEDVKPSKVETAMGKVFKDKAEGVLMFFTVLLSVALAIGIFMMLPFFLSEIFKNKISSYAVRGLVEGVIRIAIFISYVKAISLLNDIKRVFMYHGAEHKTINCIENGFALTLENVRKQSKHHKRCGTSFMLIVMFVSILFFVFIQVDSVWIRMLYRLLLIPIIAGISYEFIKLAGKSDSPIVNFLSKPGMWLQRLTTKEPDDEMIEVAIYSVEAVFDWHKFLERENRKHNIYKDATLQAATLEDQMKASPTLEIEKEDDFRKMDVEEDDEILNALDRYFSESEEKEEK